MKTNNKQIINTFYGVILVSFFALIATIISEFDIFKNLGFKSALISTVEYRIADEIIPSTHTTPDIVRLNQMLAKAVEMG
ncbi:MAG TPA: hypothetical protein PLZ88_06825, partial [Aliarcobacter sp.]|nr:hypothetical protein [Aliarcobacter sp.]